MGIEKLTALFRRVVFAAAVDRQKENKGHDGHRDSVHDVLFFTEFPLHISQAITSGTMGGGASPYRQSY
jgi:hypothetical protein